MLAGYVMHNKSMERALEDGTCIDVNVIGVPYTQFPGVWVLDNFLEGMDYCDADGEDWIRSIGKDIQTGKIYASSDNRFYQNPKFVCLWLR